MMQGVVTLCMSDIGRLLGASGLLSLGITLTLWGLKRRRSGAVVIALFLCLAALVPTVLAIEHPPPGSLAQIQTSGPNGALENGDWYTSRNPDAGGPGYHSFEIYVPCTVPSGQAINVELFDPESNETEGGDLDEVRGVDDNTTFTLTNPSGVVIATTTYTPDGGTSQTWVPFTTFTRGDNGCRTVMTYTLRVTTSDDDDNAWKLRITPDDPDGTPGTGDEISVGNLKTSYQNESFGCQTFHFFVEDVISITLSNFDWDVPYLCPVVSCTLDYITPSGAVIPGTVSGSTVWNNGGPDYPPPGGNVILNPESGWWQAALCINDDNQYIFDPGPHFYDPPPPPKMSVSKDDGTETFVPGGVLTYTITYSNAGEGAALEAVLTDELPLSTTFVSCNGGLSCGEISPPGSGIVTFSLGTIVAGASGSVLVSVHVDGDVPPGCITNTVCLDYTDIVFSDYPPKCAPDVDCYQANAAIELAKTVYLGHDGGAGCPGSERVTGKKGTAVTYCFEVTNTGHTYLDQITIKDPDLGITQDDMTLLRGSMPLAPGDSLVYYYEGTIRGKLVNTAKTEGNPTDSDGNDLPGLDNPTDDDDAAVLVPTKEPTKHPPPPTPTATVPPTLVPTPTVEVVAVARLPETGDFPGGFTVFLGVLLIIGAASLLNLALLEMRGRRGNGKGD